jgi:ABC-type multidrug transport system fused ATPase/permease subunit
MVAQAQPNIFKAAYDANQVFVLRDAIEHSQAPLFYRAAVEASLNHVEVAEKDLRAVIRQNPHSNDGYEAHDLLGNMYFRNGMYRESFDEIVAALHERPNASDPKSMLSILSALNGLPKTTITESKPSSLQIEPGSTFLPLKINNKDAEFFSFAIAPGEALCIMGRSGTGKTVTLKLTIGLMAPDQGNIRIQGEDIVGLDEDKLSATRRQMGFLFQSGALFDSFTLNDNLRLLLERFTTKSKGEVDSLIQKRLDDVGLGIAVGTRSALSSSGSISI